MGNLKGKCPPHRLRRYTGSVPNFNIQKVPTLIRPLLDSLTVMHGAGMCRESKGSYRLDNLKKWFHRSRRKHFSANGEISGGPSYSLSQQRSCLQCSRMGLPSTFYRRRYLRGDRTSPRTSDSKIREKCFHSRR